MYIIYQESCQKLYIPGNVSCFQKFSQVFTQRIGNDLPFITEFSNNSAFYLKVLVIEKEIEMKNLL